MEQTDLLEQLVETLEHLAIEYFLVGAIASMAYGEPRFTRDADVVVNIVPDDVSRLAERFSPEEFHLDSEQAKEAITTQGQFNVLHVSSGMKIDFMVWKQDAFDESRFRRRRRGEIRPGLAAWFASPEDVIIKKMDYYRMGGSEKHLRDITGIIKVSGHLIDWGYIADWARQFGVEDIWEAVRRRGAGAGSGDAAVGS